MGTLTLIDGSACGHAPDSGTLVRLPARAGRFAPHQLIRTALPAIRRAVDAATFAALVMPWRPALSLMFALPLSDDEQQLAHSLSARLSSHLTHNIPMQELLWDELAGFVLAAHAVAPLVIVVEDLAQLDACSAALLRRLLRADAVDVPEVVLGATLSEPAPLDAHGIQWALSRRELSNTLAALRRLPHRALPGPSTVACTCAIERDVWDRGDAERDVPAIRAIFESYAFDTALRLALDALDAGTRSDAERAALSGIAALAAHNRQFFANGNHRLADFVRAHYQEALRHEADPALRASWCYRLAVTHARRRGDLAAASEVIAAGLHETAALPALERALQSAWLHNIDAMVQARRGDVEAAFACCERAYALLAGAVAPDRVMAAEIALSELVLAENALTLAAMSGDEPRRAQWLARSGPSFARWPSLDVVQALEEQRAYIDRLEPAAARACTVQALDRVSGKLNPLLEHFILVCLSDLSFRIADYAAAASYGDAAHALAEELGDMHRTQLPLELRACEIAEARGDLDAAEHALQALLASHAPMAVELHGRLARLAARRGARESALAHVDEAIALASDTGELDQLVRASCHAGEVADLLGLPDDARTAYASCLELLEDSPSTASRELLRLRAVLGQHRLGTADPAHLDACVAMLPRLMARERDAWPLARALAAAPPAHPLPPASAAALERITTALASAHA